MTSKLETVLVAAAAGLLLSAGSQSKAETVELDPGTLKQIATIDPAYQSYNVELVSIIGGKWWAPYDAAAPGAAAGAAPPGGINPSALSQRPPLDLASPRLRRLATALSPAIMRVSDKWANSTYFQVDGPPAPPPAGFDAVLSASRWKSVVDFSNGVGARLMTSFAISSGTRDADGVWTPSEAGKILAYTAKFGGKIAAAEFFNEPNLAVMEGAPKGYDAAQYGRDFKLFEAFVRRQSPGTLIFGPGSVGELHDFSKLPGVLKSSDMLTAGGGGLDGVSYHFYGAFSQRCASMGAQYQIAPAAALSPAWLTAVQGDTAFYGELRNRFAPDKPLWLTETSQAACGGDRWAADFVDTFRYLNQLGLLARNGVGMSMHNTLIGSDYGLIDEKTLQPRPDYWGALLWRKLVGTKVLDAGQNQGENLYLYAFDQRNAPRGRVILAINADPRRTITLHLSSAFRRYTLTAPALLGTQVLLNGRMLNMRADGRLPAITGRPGSGPARLAPQSITFFEVDPAPR